ncbi:hypothetical protein C356_06831 [Cryptococcus neoformans c45]|nr:hypothetical protein C356_06831 [Cryptococcus neoformans var. grubii c45]
MPAASNKEAQVWKGFSEDLEKCPMQFNRLNASGAQDQEMSEDYLDNEPNEEETRQKCEDMCIYCRSRHYSDGLAPSMILPEWLDVSTRTGTIAHWGMATQGWYLSQVKLRRRMGSDGASRARAGANNAK